MRWINAFAAKACAGVSLGSLTEATGPVGGGFPTVVVVVVVVVVDDDDDDDDAAVLVAEGNVELDAPRVLRRAWFVDAWSPATATPTRFAEDLCVRPPGFVFVGDAPVFGPAAVLLLLSPLAHELDASGARDAMFCSICAYALAGIGVSVGIDAIGAPDD